MVTANSDATFCCFRQKKLLLSFPQFGACKTKFMKLKCRSSDVTGHFYRLFHNATLFLWENNAFWEILVIMAVIAVISFQFPKRDFFDVLQHTNTMQFAF